MDITLYPTSTESNLKLTIFYSNICIHDLLWVVQIVYDTL